MDKIIQQSQKAVIYLRVSTEEQVDNYSLDTQNDICTREAERRGYTISHTFREEGRSAKNIHGRPALIEMLEYCRKHKKEIDAVIVYRLDRISRQTADYLAIRKKLFECEIMLISATEPTGNSPTEKFVETMLAGFAQMDNDVRGERSRNGLRARFLAGLGNGCAPLGYLNQNGYAVKDPETFEEMKKGWELMATGKKTLREMAQILNERGLKGGAKKGKVCPVRAQMLNRIFRNKFYTGKVISSKHGQEVLGQHPPMITEEQYYKVQAILDGRNTNISVPLVRRNRDNPDFPLRRIVKCKNCGTSLTGAWSKGKRQLYGYYFCPKRCVPDSNIRVETLEQATTELLNKVALTSQTTELLMAYLRKKYFERIATLQKRRDRADIELKKLYEFRQALIEKNMSGIYSDEMFKEQNQLAEEKIKNIQITKNDELIAKYNLEEISKFIKNKLENLSQTYLDSGLEEKRILLCSIYPSGLAWGHNSYSNTIISKFYTAILDLQEDCVSFGSGTGIRTPIVGTKTRCPTIRRSPNIYYVKDSQTTS